jgi:2-polyprenyl-3-methyl-5-hydroxy-6-metoxy-1,4-benzoquinol methylase
MLWSVLSPDGSIVVMDTRTSSVRPQVALSGLERVAYEFCDETHSAARVARELRIEFPEERFSDEQVKDFLESMVANRFMVTDGINYLSLAIPTYAIEKVLELRKGAFPPAVVHQAVPELQVL